MRYAIIKNEICENIIEVAPEVAITIGAVGLPDGFGIGDSCQNGVWKKKPLEVLEPSSSITIEQLHEEILLIAEVLVKQHEEGLK